MVYMVGGVGGFSQQGAGAQLIGSGLSPDLDPHAGVTKENVRLLYGLSMKTHPDMINEA